MKSSFKIVSLCYITTFSGGSKPEMLCGSPLPPTAKHAGRLNQVNVKCSSSWISLNVLKPL